MHIVVPSLETSINLNHVYVCMATVFGIYTVNRFERAQYIAVQHPNAQCSPCKKNVCHLLCVLRQLICRQKLGFEGNFRPANMAAILSQSGNHRRFFKHETSSQAEHGFLGQQVYL